MALYNLIRRTIVQGIGTLATFGFDFNLAQQIMSINIPNSILFEDDVILVINKPGGLMVEPDRNNYPNLQQEVKNYLKKTFHESGEVYAQHIHRLDRVVSGVILFAKQRSVLKNLSEQFAERKVKKTYQALTFQSPSVLEGSLKHWHRKEKKKAALYTEQIEHAEMASLSYRISTYDSQRFLWNIDLHTGKYHQIRAQLASTGCPIIGDQLYGSLDAYRENEIALHASSLTFLHPVTAQEMEIRASATFQ